MEAGTGSGILTSYLAKYAKKVYSYDINESNLNLAKNNTKDFKNITFKHQDITEGIKEKELDTIILDMPEPERAIEHCFKALKQGGYLTIYLPNMTQVIDFVNTNDLFSVEQVLNIMPMPWQVGNKKAKPQPKDMLHTAFLIFCRKT